MSGRILVTPRSMTQFGLDSLEELQPLRDAGFDLVSGPAGRLPRFDDLKTVPRDITGWLAGVEEITSKVLDLFPTLVGISRNGAGSDTIDHDAAALRGIQVATARGANARGVAELALANILNGLRSIPVANVNLHDGKWIRELGREMPDIVVGIIGYGAIGRILATFTTGMGSRTLVYDPYAVIGAEDNVESVSLDVLFKTSDVVSLHSPPTADGKPIIGRGEVSQMKQNSVVVNAARSSLVDPGAILEGFESGQISAYAVDAFDSEPPVLSDLLRHSRTIMTPHLGGYTSQSIKRASQQSVTNLLAILSTSG